MPRYAVVAAVNNPEILAANLARSPDLQTGRIDLYTIENAASAGVAYNEGIDNNNADIIIFAHQDVYLPKYFFERLSAWIALLDDNDPDWGVAGVFGLTTDSVLAGRVWSSGLAREIRADITQPKIAAALDELLLIVRRKSGLKFDSFLPSFHLYGTDIVQSARALGMHSYIIQVPVIHNSRPVASLIDGYPQAYRFMQRKWRSILPIHTLICTVGRTPFHLWRAHLRRWRARSSAKNYIPQDASVVAVRLGYGSHPTPETGDTFVD